jgi:chromosome segregation ATPase
MTVGSEYAYVADGNEQRLRTIISDMDSKLREKDMQLSRCHDELGKCRNVLKDKKEEVKEKELIIQRQREELDRLHQTSSRAQPQVAQTEAVLQSQVQHYRRLTEEQAAQMEQLRRQAPAPPGTPDIRELSNLRDEVQWHRRERQRMLGEIGALKSSQEVLTAQVSLIPQCFSHI